MEEIVSVPVCPFQYDVIDELIVNVPKTQTFVIKPLDGGMRFIKNNAVVLHTVIILVNTLLTRIFLPPWHNESSVGVNRITLDAKSAAKIVKILGKPPKKKVKFWKNKESHGVYSITLLAERRSAS